jgi:hypothetical protein
LRDSAIKQGIPLNLGKPEEPFITKFSPAIFKNMKIAEAYDFIETFRGEKPNIKNGTSSSDYASSVADCAAKILIDHTKIPNMTEKELNKALQEDYLSELY